MCIFPVASALEETPVLSASPQPLPWALEASRNEITFTEISCKHSQEQPLSLLSYFQPLPWSVP